MWHGDHGSEKIECFSPHMIHINIHKPEHFLHGSNMILPPFLNFGNGMQWPHLVNGHLARVLRVTLGGSMAPAGSSWFKNRPSATGRRPCPWPSTPAEGREPRDPMPSPSHKKNH